MKEDRCRSLKELKQNDHPPHITYTPPPTHTHTPNLDLKEMKLPLIKDIGSPVLIENLLFTIAKVFKQARLTIDGCTIHIYILCHCACAYIYISHIYISYIYQKDI